ncbi:MAG: SPASM domain-containing protein [Phycisphaeraceae bacterium]
MTSIAIIQVDLTRGRFGHAVSVLDEFAGKTILQHTIDRAARIVGIDEIVLMHPADQTLNPNKVSDTLFTVPSDGPAVTTAVMQTRAQDAWLHDVIGSGRKWSLTAWRGGIGGMTVYDELLPAYPWLRVAQDRQAESVVALRADWCMIDPALATKQLELHRSAPEAMKVTFTQAPPGLAPIVLHHSVLKEMTDHSATVANLLCYNPKKPVIDPMGKDVNVQVPASVRSQYRRFIYDTPRAVEHLQALASNLGDELSQADAVAVTDASRAVEANEPWRELERLPQQINVELSPRREVNGPIVPQHYLNLPREDMSRQTVDALLKELSGSSDDRVAGDESASPRKELGWTELVEVGSGGSPSLHAGYPNALHLTNDSAVLFGGLGDPLLHEDWFETLVRAAESGLLGVGIETDLLVDDEAVDRLATLPLDVIAVRINADSAATYEQLMGVDGYAKVMDNLQRLFKARNVNRQNGTGFRGWVVPRLVKVAENLSDLETFFERWMTVSGWAVVDRALTGRGLIPDMSPVPMEVPGSLLSSGNGLVPPKQRLTVLSDGTVCLCGEDWLGRMPLGSMGDAGLAELWRGCTSLADVNEGHSCVCPRCAHWLEARRHALASTSLSKDGRS